MFVHHSVVLFSNAHFKITVPTNTCATLTVHSGTLLIIFNRLFSYVNESLFNRPTYQVFLNLRGEFNPDVTKPETNTTKKSNDINTFLDTVMKTEVFNSMWQFLQSYSKL